MKFGKLKGVVLAMPTPLLENEDVDIASLCKLIDSTIEGGADAIMMLGTIGEGVALLHAQRELLVEATVAHVAGRLPVLATVSAASTRKTIANAKSLEKSGVDFLVSTPAFYNKFPDPQSHIDHIQRLADATTLPLIFYNAPGFTGNALDADTIEKILNMERIAGIKDSSCNFSMFAELLRRYPNKSTRPGTIMQGDESVFDASLMLGADGVVSGGGVMYVKLLKELCSAGLNKNLDQSIALQTQFSKKLMDVLLPNPGRNWLYNIKRELVYQGIIAHAHVSSPFLDNMDTCAWQKPS
jgi:4-hydroxy-tetrahydrodipicolinate synthase